MARRRPLLCLTRNANDSLVNAKTDGTYTYCVADLTEPCFPAAEPDAGGSRRPIPFSRGTLTDRTDTGVRWAWTWHTSRHPRKDILFDLKRDCLIERVDICAEGMLAEFEVAVRASREKRWRYIAGQPGEPVGNFERTWPALTDLHTWGRHVKVQVLLGWGRIISVRIWGRELAGRLIPKGLVHENSRPAVVLPRATRAGPPRGELDYGARNPDAIRIVPHPQEMKRRAGALRLREGGAIVLSAEPTESERFAAGLVREKLAQKLGLRFSIRAGADPRRGDIVLGRAAAARIRREKLAVKKKEGSGLLVDAEGIYAAGADEAGTFYAAQTLVQLFDVAAERGAASIPCLRIRDWPYQALRGVHLYSPGPTQLRFFKKYVRDFVSRHKLNTIIFETAAGIYFESHPEINRAWARKAAEMERDPVRYPGHVHHHSVGGGRWITQAQAAEIIDWCRKHHIELIPEIQSLSHCEYLLQAHPEICEVPPNAKLSPEQRLQIVGSTGSIYRDVPVAFCPSNPKSYKILFDISEEIHRLFQPKTVSIGHDEWREQQICPKCRRKRGWELFEQDVLKTHRFWKERGVELIIWSDHFLEGHNGAERHDWTARCLPHIPRDVIMCNWSAGGNPDSIELFRKEGFRQLFLEYGNYFASPPILRRTYGKVNCHGIVATTWIRTDEFHYGIKGCFYGQLFTADNAWSPNHPLVRKGDYASDFARAFERVKREFRGRALPSETPGPKTYQPVDLRRFANLGLADPDFLGLGEDLRHLPTGRVRLAGVPFTVINPRRNGGKAVIALENPKRLDPRTDLPVKVENIRVGKRADSLAFLHAVSEPDTLTWSFWKAESCRYVIEYADGKKRTFHVMYGQHIQHWRLYHGMDRSVTAHLWRARMAWRGATSRRNHATLWLAEWINPRPAVPIRAVHFLSPHRASTSRPLLFAITAIRAGS